MADPVPNTMVDGRYRVVSRLGSGGMADVFLAEDQQLGRKVALKLLHHRFAEDPDFVERFRREAQAAAGLQHPNVVSVYDRGTFDDTYYIAMEYLPGRSLKQLIRQEAPLDPLRAIDITIQILKAARFAHRRGVIHRDLKPHNVIVDDSDHAKVTDFGIARAGASDMTETGSIMGTAQYLSPEQAQGHAVNAGSDLYSIGVVLYEMLTGRVPFDAESAVTIALKHVSEAPTPPRQLNPNIPPELEQTVLWVLNKNASDRPADADQLITVLEHCREAIASAGAGQHTASMAAVAAAGAAAGAGAAIAGPGIAAYRQAQEQATNGSGEMSAVRPPPEDHERQRLEDLGMGAARGAAGGRRGRRGVLPHAAQAGAGAQGHRGADQRRAHDGGAGQVPGRHRLGAQPPARRHRRGRVPGRRDQGRQGLHRDPDGVQRPGQRVRALGAGADGGRRPPGCCAEPGSRSATSCSQSSNRFAQGQVTGTNPGTARSVPRGTAVTLFVSSGQPQKKVPNVVGESQTQATEDLTRAGFDVQQRDQSTPTQSDVGNVISQSPSGNTNAARRLVGHDHRRDGADHRLGADGDRRSPGKRRQRAHRVRVQGGPADRDRHQPQPEWRRDLPEPRRQLHRQEGQHGDHHDRQAGPAPRPPRPPTTTSTTPTDDASTTPTTTTTSTSGSPGA